MSLLLSQSAQGCGRDLQGRAYVALGAEVFLLPDPGPAPPEPKPMFFSVPSGQPLIQPDSPAAAPLTPPDESALPGCVGNPLQRQIVSLNATKLLGDKPAGLESLDPADELTLTVERMGDLRVHGKLGHFSPWSGEAQIIYATREASFCTSAAGRASMDSDAHGCFFRPFRRPNGGWTGGYESGVRGGVSVSGETLSFSCEPNRADSSLTSCHAGYTLKPELDLTLTWIQLTYDMTFKPPTRAALLEGMLTYDRAVRVSLAAANVTDYHWPIQALTAWKKRQPSVETLRQLGAVISPSHSAASNP